MRTLLRLTTGAALMALAACVPLPPIGALFVQIGPPAYVEEEVVPVAPGPDYVWVAGYWSWTGVEYTWVPGVWVARPYPGARWEAGRWHRHAQGWYWAPGRWRGGDHDDHGEHGDRDH